MNTENTVSKLVITNKFIVKGELEPLHDGMLKYISNKVWSESASNDSFNVLNEAHALSHSEVASLDLNPSVLEKDGSFKIMVSRNPVLKMAPHLGVMQLSYFFKENHNVFLESIIITKNEAMYNEDKLVVKVGRVGPMTFNDLEQERVLSNYHFIHGNALRSYIDEMIEVQRNEENGDCPVELVLRPGTYIELSHVIFDTDKINQVMQVIKDAPVNKSLWNQTYPMYNALSDKGKPVSMDDYPYGLFADVEGLIGQLHTPNDPHGFEHLGMVMIPINHVDGDSMEYEVKLISRNRNGNGMGVYNLFRVSAGGSVERRTYKIVSREVSFPKSTDFVERFKQLIKLIENPNQGGKTDMASFTHQINRLAERTKDNVLEESPVEVKPKPKTSSRRGKTSMKEVKQVVPEPEVVKKEEKVFEVLDEQIPNEVIEENSFNRECKELAMLVELFPNVFIGDNGSEVNMTLVRMTHLQLSPETIAQMEQLLKAKREVEALAKPLEEIVSNIGLHDQALLLKAQMLL